MSQIYDLEAARQLIDMQLKDIGNIQTKAPYGLEYSFWEDFTAKIIDRIYGNESRQRHGFEQAGRGGCFSVFESYSEHQRRDDFIEIINGKREFLENLITNLENRQHGQEAVATPEDSFGETESMELDFENILKSPAASPLDLSVAEILHRIKDPSLLEEARANLLELRYELLKTTPSWSKLKRPMVWLVELGKEEFFSVLPFIVLYIRKITD